MYGRRVLEYAKALDKLITIKKRKEWAQGTPEEWANA
jgi:hypothetical protein